MSRIDGRLPNEVRSLTFVPHFQSQPAGSCLVKYGKTSVLCSVSIEDSIPPFLRGSKRGWLSAEYAMLPGSSQQRVSRERTKTNGRSLEIQRLIGRCLRTAVDCRFFGERSLLVDCDVLEADGGTRTAAITGSVVAVALALQKLESQCPGAGAALTLPIAAVSVGMIESQPLVDLCYQEDKDAEVDLNVIQCRDGRFIEIQGTAEREPYTLQELQQMLELATQGLQTIFEAQERVLQSFLP